MHLHELIELISSFSRQVFLVRIRLAGSQAPGWRYQPKARTRFELSAIWLWRRRAAACTKTACRCGPKEAILTFKFLIFLIPEFQAIFQRWTKLWVNFSYPLPEYWYAFSWQNWVTVPSADCKLLTEFLLPRPFKFSITFPTVPGLARFEPRTFILRILRPRHLRHGDPNCKLRFEFNQFELTTCHRVKNQ